MTDQRAENNEKTEAEKVDLKQLQFNKTVRAMKYLMEGLGMTRIEAYKALNRARGR